MNSGRYELVEWLGDGTFGRCVLGKDTLTVRDVAIKIVRGVKTCSEGAMTEASILSDIRRADPGGTFSRSAEMLDMFIHHEAHVCIVLAFCGRSLCDVLKLNSWQGFWLQDIQRIARESMAGLSFLHEVMWLIHADLKPENIVLASPSPLLRADFPREKHAMTTPYFRPACCAVKLIDFGCATYKNQYHTSVINTRPYRGPEVVLAAGWDELSDVWSLACVIAEMYSGQILFDVRDEGGAGDLEHLAMFQQAMRCFLPQSLLWAASDQVKSRSLIYCPRGFHLRRTNLDAQESSRKRVYDQRSVRDFVAPHHLHFASFLEHLLVIDPIRRPTMRCALTHPFFRAQILD